MMKPMTLCTQPTVMITIKTDQVQNAKKLHTIKKITKWRTLSAKILIKSSLWKSNVIESFRNWSTLDAMLKI